MLNHEVTNVNVTRRLCAESKHVGWRDHVWASVVAAGRPLLTRQLGSVFNPPGDHGPSARSSRACFQGGEHGYPRRIIASYPYTERGAFFPSAQSKKVCDGNQLCWYTTLCTWTETQESSRFEKSLLLS